MTRTFRAHSRPSWMFFTLGVVFSLMTLQAQALTKDEASNALNNIYRATINSYYSVNGFYNFSANQADQSQLAQIKESIGIIDESVANLEITLAEGANAETFASVADSWTAYRKVLEANINEVVETGYPDLRLAGDMASTNINLNNALQGLYTSVMSTSGFTPADIIQTSRDAASTIALMMTKYSARSTSTVSQVYTGGDTDLTIDSLAKEFESKLKSLIGGATGKAEALDLLDAAMTKWDFIKNSYINYNENRVNFIVNLYSKKIITDIEGATAAL
ncbi:MAG: hypothetical protein R3183_02110 [Oleiphilaceae bacterium]|nr:hypothetical protein [Oleiphilaceae bacterium]